MRLGRWTAPPQQRHLTVDLQASDSAPGAAGAVVEVETAGGTFRVVQRLHPGRGAVLSRRLRVGLGDVKGVNTVRVWWPSGLRSQLSGIALDSVVTVKESDAASAPSAGADAGANPDAGAIPDAGATSDAGAAASEPLPTSDVPWSGPPQVAQKATSTLPAAQFTLTSLPGLAATEPGYARCTAVADWDGDGDDDVALVYMTKQSAEVRVWLGAQTSVKVTPINASLFVPAGGCAVTDADDDGAPDLVLAGSPGLMLLRGDGKEASQTRPRSAYRPS